MYNVVTTILEGRRKIMKKFAILIAVCLFALVGCVNEPAPEVSADAEQAEFRLATPNTDPVTESTDTADSTTDVQEDQDDFLDLPDGRAFFDMFNEPVVLLQFQPLTPGEELVVLHTNHGDITLRLFPEEAPLSVENFLTHARNGYYDGVIFHRVIQDFMIQGGDPTGTGGGGESIWGDPFFVKWMILQLFDEPMPEDVRLELPSIRLNHFRGALAMAHAGGSMGSQFYIVHNSHGHPGIPMQAQHIISQLAEIGEVPEGLIQTLEEVAEKYLIHGGTPHLDWWWDFVSGHIVFGHVVEGMDIVDAIAEVAVDSGSRPIDDVIIESISFVIYGEM